MVDYAYSFWHVDCVRKTGLKAFTVRYEAFCRKHHYIYQPSKPEELFNASKELVAVFPKETSYKLLIQQSIQQLNLASAHIEQLRREMNALASTLPEYEVVMGMYGVGKTYGPQSLLRLAMFQDLPIGRQSLLLQVSIRCGAVRAAQLKEQQSFQMWNRQAP